MNWFSGKGSFCKNDQGIISFPTEYNMTIFVKIEFSLKGDWARLDLNCL